MPALTPAQRQKQIELQKQREAAAKAKNKPKPGQKGATTGGGSKTKGDTVGGAKPATKSTAKPAAKSSYKVADYKDAQGNVYDGNTGRLKSAAKPKAKASPAPSSRPASTSSRSSGGGSTQSSAKASSSPSQSNPPKQFNPGRGTSKTDNPLIKNDEWLMGKIKGREDSERNEKLKNVSGKNFDTTSDTYNPSTKVDGSKYTSKTTNQTGTAYNKGTDLKPSPAQPAKPASPNKKPDVGYKPSTQINKNYADKKPANNTNTAYNAKNNLLEELRKRRTNR